MGQNEAALWAVRALEEIDHPVRPLGNELIVTASLGIALCPSDGQTHATLLMNAETAMYRMKLDGRNGYRFFTRDIQEHSERTLALGYALRSALDKQEFRLLYQPEVSVASGALVGVEALLRWNSPQLGEVMPAEFIPVAESYGLIGQLGEWVLRTALAQAKRLQSDGLGGLTVGVNLSALQFAQPDLANSMIRIVRETGVDPRMLEIELTEAAAMKSLEQAARTMRELGDYGFRIAIDDFGTGYSSLSYLKRFDVDKLKIDQSFIRDLATSSDDQAIVTAIIQMAHSLGMVAVAEGVETPEQLDFLREKGCDLAQGYLFSYPLTPDNLEKFAENHRTARWRRLCQPCSSFLSCLRSWWFGRRAKRWACNAASRQFAGCLSRRLSPRWRSTPCSAGLSADSVAWCLPRRPICFSPRGSSAYICC